MFALTRLVREGSSSSSLVAGALLAFALSTPARAQCGDEVVLKYLDSGTTAPALITPRGAPVIGGDFSFRVFEAPPLSMGFLIYSGFDNPVFDPLFDATIWTTTPFFSKSFGTNALGRSGPLFFTSVVTDDLCGAQATFQALVMGGSSPSGFAVTNAMRIRVGSVTRPPLAYPTLETDGTETPSGLALGDMDEDGIRDLVSFSRPDSMAWVRPGLAAGGFDVGQKTQLASFSTTFYDVDPIELGDFDGDGHLDFVRKEEGGLAFAYGDGAGGFLGEFVVLLPRPVSQAHAADLNNDGNLDVVSGRVGGGAAADGNQVSVLLGTSSGFFAFPVHYPAVITSKAGVGADARAADLDEDGDLDLVVAIALSQPPLFSDPSYETSVLEGAGNGTFGRPVSYSNATGIGTKLDVNVALADFDGDTFIDVAMTYEDNRRIYVRLGNGDLTLGPVAEHTVGNEPHEIAVADIDGDAILDLLTRNSGSNDVSVLLGLGDGSFAPGRAFGVFDLSRGMAVDDVDFDGSQDFLVATLSSLGDRIFHVAGNGDGTFAGAHRYLFGEQFAVMGDFDGDGANDVITGAESASNLFSTDLFLHRYNANGTFGPAEIVSTVDIKKAQALELTGDAFIDLIVLKSTDVISVLPGLGDGTFGPELDAFTPTNSFFTLADFDGDQVLDLAANRSDSGIDVALGNGDGTFAAPVTHPITQQVSHFAVGDVDGNTTQDLVYRVTVGGERILMLPGNGNGTFGPEQTLVTSQTDSPYLVDLGEDGDLDIVFEDLVGSTRQIFHYANDGTGTFALAQTVASGNVSEFLFADMDGDGYTDVLARVGDSIDLLLWEEPGVLGPPTGVFLGNAEGSIAIGDLDRDGMPDIAVADDSAAVGRLSIRFNQVGE